MLGNINSNYQNEKQTWDIPLLCFTGEPGWHYWGGGGACLYCETNPFTPSIRNDEYESCFI